MSNRRDSKILQRIPAALDKDSDIREIRIRGDRFSRSRLPYQHTYVLTRSKGRRHDRHELNAIAGTVAEDQQLALHLLVCEQIRQSEQFGRSLYAAPIGWVDAADNAEFLVGIRSALLEGNQARLYAGAGIVAGSNPQKELAEVQLKLRALLQALV